MEYILVIATTKSIMDGSVSGTEFAV